jgi:hypothetical protein
MKNDNIDIQIKTIKELAIDQVKESMKRRKYTSCKKFWLLVYLNGEKMTFSAFMNFMNGKLSVEKTNANKKRILAAINKPSK